jgi:hypothetical protein
MKVMSGKDDGTCMMGLMHGVDDEDEGKLL